MTAPTQTLLRVEILRTAAEQLDVSRQQLAKDNVRLAEAIREARASGMTLQAIGDVLGLTRQRVKQMLDAERKP